MKKLFKAHAKQPQPQHDDLDRERDPRSISPFTVLPNPPSPDAQFQQHQHQQQAVPRERILNERDRERDRTYRNSMVTYPSSDDISNWELIQVHGQHTHPYRQQKQDIVDRERSASLASLSANPYPYSQPQPQHHAYAPPTPQAPSASRTSSLNSLPPGASQLAAAPSITPPGSGQPPGSAGSYAPSPTSPAGTGALRKKSPAAPQSQAKDTQSGRANPSTATILRALDPSMMGGMGPSVHTQQTQYEHQQRLPLVSVPSIRSPHSRGVERDAHPHPHPHLRVPILTSRREKARSTRDRSRSLSLSDIEFGAGEIGSDDDVNRPAEPDIDLERDSLDQERQAREARWRERDLEIEGKAARKGGRESKGFFERLQLGDGEAKREGVGPKEREEKEKERKEKERKEKEDWKVQWTNIFSTAKDKDKDRVKMKKDIESVDPLSPPHPRLDTSTSLTVMQLIPTHGNSNANPNPTMNGHQQHTHLAANVSSQVQIQGPNAQSHAQSDPLTRMVGLFVSPSNAGVINWALALELCEQTKGSERKDGKEGRDGKEGEANAKSVAKALRKELKYARPSEQLGAVTLWAVMLQNASDYFITQTSSRKFLDVVEDIILHSRSAIVRDRLLEVLGAAAYLSNEKSGRDAAKLENFRALWRKVKPEILPDEGVPLSTDNAMFRSLSTDWHPDRDADRRRARPPMFDKRSARNGIIPVDEDIRRLLQECKIGRGNAALLNEALAFATPEDLKEKDIIKEFYAKCRASQELIHAQIPWASAGAEHSRVRQLEAIGDDALQISDEIPSTREEKLLAELLRANEDLAEALRIHGDIERIGYESEAERKARERSKVEIRANAADYQLSGEASSFLAAPSTAPSSSRSQSPSSFLMNSQTSQVSSFPPSFDTTKYAGESTPASALQQHLTSPQFSGSESSHSHSQSHLAPVPCRPLHGPRSPTPSAAVTVAGSVLSRTSSPAQVSRPSSIAHSRGTSVDTNSEPIDVERGMVDATIVYGAAQSGDLPSESCEPGGGVVNLSEKAAGKRRMLDGAADLQDGYIGIANETIHVDDAPSDLLQSDFDMEDGYVDETLGPDRWKIKVHYAYDAAAERTKERIRGMVCSGLG